MARNLLITTLLCLATLSSAQTDIPNSSFEEWIIQGDDTIPQGWSISQFGAGKADDASAGSSAVSLWNWYSYAEGTLTSGPIPISVEPSAGELYLLGSYKYLLGQNGGSGHSTDDSAMVTIVLRSTTADTVGFAVAKLGPATSFENFTIPVSVTAKATSMELYFLSSERGFCTSENGECCYLTLDDLRAVTVEEGVHEVRETAEPAMPNPFERETVLGVAPDEGCTLIVTSIQGGKVTEQTFLPGERIILSAENLPSGTYLYRIISKIDIRTGKVIKQ